MTVRTRARTRLRFLTFLSSLTATTKPRFLRVHMFKTPDRRVSVTLTWSAPLNPPNILLGFQIFYGYNHLGAPDFEEIARFDVDVV